MTGFSPDRARWWLGAGTDHSYRVITLGRDLGYEVSEEKIDVNEMLADVKSGKITEEFAYKDEEFIINNNEVGPVTK